LTELVEVLSRFLQSRWVHRGLVQALLLRMHRFHLQARATFAHALRSELQSLLLQRAQRGLRRQ
jgi:hypothetical protein